MKADYLSKFIDRIMPIPESGCWVWMGTIDGGGYGMFYDGKKSIRAHRYSYENYKGPIPKGLVIDHKCRVRCCVNPDHLRAVTLRTNALENNVSILAKNAAKTHCPYGHEYSLENTIIKQTNGSRFCRICKNKLAEAYRRRKGIRTIEERYGRKVWRPKKQSYD